MKKEWKSFVEGLFMTISAFILSFLLMWISTFPELSFVCDSLRTGASIVMVGAIYALFVTIYLYPNYTVEG